MEENNLFKIGITHGDFNGIGYEIIMKALADNKILELCTPVVYGIGKVAAAYKKGLDLGDFSMQVIKNIQQANNKKANLLNISDEEVTLTMGEENPVAGKMAVLALNVACKDLQDKQIDALVTAPVNANVMPFPFPGHAKYLADKLKLQDGLQMMIAEPLKLAFVTTQLPVEKVGEKLSKDLIVAKLKTLDESLQRDFRCTNPKIAVLALNKLSGDGGKFGKTEQEIIKPAIEEAFAAKINSFGPFSADEFFASEEYLKFDAVLVMCQEQGMMPFKSLSMEEAVKFTAGLPIVHTAPVQDVAYDIAGQNLAHGESLRNALYCAMDILRNRQKA